MWDAWSLKAAVFRIKHHITNPTRRETEETIRNGVQLPSTELRTESLSHLPRGHDFPEGRTSVCEWNLRYLKEKKIPEHFDASEEIYKKNHAHVMVFFFKSKEQIMESPSTGSCVKFSVPLLAVR